MSQFSGAFQLRTVGSRLLLFLFFVALAAYAETSLLQTTNVGGSERAVNLSLPVSFEMNRGQAGKGVDFVARGNGYVASLNVGQVTLDLDRAGKLCGTNAMSVCHAQVTINLVGASRHSKFQPEDKLQGYSNYLFGSDPGKWVTHVTQYAKVRYANIYSGIDVVYYGSQSRLEHDFVVHAGADPSQIRLAFSGVQQTELSSDGALVLHVSDSEVRMAKPRTYQVIGNAEVEVPSQYVRGKRGVFFRLGRYDAHRTLIIDPVLVYSTFLSGQDGLIQRATAIAVDGSRNVYVAGLTDSASFPVTPGVIQPTQPQHAAFVSKINAAGTALIYSTYVGGFIRQSFSSNSVGLSVDTLGDVYVAGDTAGNDLPIPSGSSPVQATNKGNNVAILKLNNTATNVLYATYLGGSGTDRFAGIGIDALGNAHVAGTTTSNDFPLQHALQSSLGTSGQSGFISVVDPTGSSLVYSTYLGQNSTVTVTGMAIDLSSNTYVVGTASAGFVAPFFVAKLDANGSLVYAISCHGSVIAVDRNGNAYVSGGNESSEVIEKFDPTGLLTSSIPLNFNVQSVGAMALDTSQNIYIVGTSMVGGSCGPGCNPPIFPLMNPIQQTFAGGFASSPSAPPSFITEVNPVSGTLLFSSWIPDAPPGGPENNVYALAVDSSGNIYVAGESRPSSAAGDFFPVFNALQPLFANPCSSPTCAPAAMSTNALILKISPAAGAAAAVSPGELQFATQAVSTTSTPQSLTIYDFGTVALNVSNATISGDFAVQSNNCGTVPVSGDFCTIQVTFTPTSTGTRTGVLTITDSSAGSPHTVALTGQGGSATLSVTPSTLSFPDQAVRTTSSPQTLTITNTGAISLQVTRIQASGDFAETNTCGSTIAPGANCAISVTFTPASTGPRTGSVTISDNAVDSPQTVSLTGTGSGGLGLSVPSGGSNTTTVAPGQTATYTLSIGGAKMSGTASLTCSGAPKGAQCSPPASEPLNPDSPANFAVTVTTTSRTIGTLHPLGSSTWMWAIALLSWVALPWTPVSQKSIRRSFFLLASGLLLCLQCSCGGSGGTSSGGPQPNPNATPAGTYSLTVTATSAGMSQSTPLTLTVQ
jgi:HYDIN/CFA65/VesB family protein/beta-propeller repeat-containing protein